MEIEQVKRDWGDFPKGFSLLKAGWWIGAYKLKRWAICRKGLRDELNKCWDIEPGDYMAGKNNFKETGLEKTKDEIERLKAAGKNKMAAV